MYTFADLHCDTITACYERNESISKNNLHISIEKLKNFKNPTQIFAIWLSIKYHKSAFDTTNKMIDFFESELKKNSDFIKLAINYSDIEESNKINAMLSIEGGESIEDKIDNLEHFYKRGVRFLTFCWNYENNIGYGAFTKSNEGLKDFGKDVVKEMNNLNMVIDVSHLNEAGFWDIYKLSKKPFIATHSNAYSICNHFRNLKDDQLKAIKDCNGLVGINLYPHFLNSSGYASYEDIFRHIDYIEKLIGIDNICIGGDLDGIDITPKNIDDISGYNNLFEKMEIEYGKDVLEKISYKNFYNFCKLNLKY